MKNYILFLFTIISLTAISQNEDDALRYTQEGIYGTAKYTAMGGALSAMGGEVSSISDNPASIGMFIYSEVNFTPTLHYTKNNTIFLNSPSSEEHLKFNFNNFAYIGTQEIENSDWKFINWGFTYKRINNFNSNTSILAFNEKSSITDYFAEASYGNTLEELRKAPEYSNASDIAYNSYNDYLIDPISEYKDNIEYVSHFENYGEEQSQYIKKRGREDDYSFSLGANYNNNLYIGASLNINNIKFSYNSIFQETDPKNKIKSLNKIIYKENFETRGSGIGAKIGFIYKITSWLRVGGAIHTPVKYELADNYWYDTYSSIKTDSKNVISDLHSGINFFDYHIKTPMKAIGAISFIFKKRGSVNLEYNYKDYSQMELSTIVQSSEFNNSNTKIKEIFKPSHNVKIGGEYRWKNLSFRAGAAYLDSPYKQSEINKNAFTLIYSGGLGLNYNLFYSDFALSYAQRNSHYFPYSSTKINAYELNENMYQFLVTLGIRF